MEFIKELQEVKDTKINKCVDLMINTIKAKNLYQKGGWDAVDKELGDNYLNPCFNVSDIAIYRKLEGLNLNLEDNMKEIENRVNAKLGVKAIQYRIDRLHHHFVILL